MISDFYSFFIANLYDSNFSNVAPHSVSLYLTILSTLCICFIFFLCLSLFKKIISFVTGG